MEIKERYEQNYFWLNFNNLKSHFSLPLLKFYKCSINLTFIRDVIAFKIPPSVLIKLYKFNIATEGSSKPEMDLSVLTTKMKPNL